MFNIVVNGKEITIDVLLIEAIPKIKGTYKTQEFYCAVCKNTIYTLLLDKNIVGVGLWRDDQETIKRIHEAYIALKPVTGNSVEAIS